MIYLLGFIGVVVLCGLVAWLVVDHAQRRGQVVVLKIPKVLRWVVGIELYYLFSFFVDHEGKVPLWLFLASAVLALAAFGFEPFVNHFQREDLQGKPLQVVDQAGKIFQLTREKFTADVLPEIFKQVGSNPDQLYKMIVKAIGDGLADQCVQPALRLRMVDENIERSTVLLAEVYARNHAWEEMEQVLLNYQANVGDSALILFRLAWAYRRKDDAESFEEFLWQGFDLDANHRDGFKLLVSQNFDDVPGGYDPDVLLRRLAAYPNSWRARIMLADQFFRKGQDEEALKWVEEAYPNSVEEPWAIYQLSEVLAVHHLYERVVEYIAPVFNLDHHGPETGINLALAYLYLEEKTRGLEIIKILRRYDWPRLERQIASLERRLLALP